MPTTAQVCTSKSIDSAAAGTEAATGAMAGLAGAEPSLMLVYATADHDHDELLAGIAKVAPGVPIAGGSGEGIIANEESDESLAAVAMMAIASDRIRFHPFLVEDYGCDPEAAGRQLAALVNAEGAAARCLWLMPDGLHGNCTTLLRTLHAEVTLPIPIVGGAAVQDLHIVGEILLEGRPGERIVHLCIGEPLRNGGSSSYDPSVIRTPLELDKASGSLFFPGGGLTEGGAITVALCALYEHDTA